MMRVAKKVPDLVLEASIARTGSKGNRFEGPNTDTQLGFLAIHRLRWGLSRNLSVFTEVGMGLLYVDRLTIDLDSHINSTPLVGGGFLIGPDQQYLVALRVLHISNGGLTQRNFGQNMLYLTIGAKL